MSEKCHYCVVRKALVSVIDVWKIGSDDHNATQSLNHNHARKTEKSIQQPYITLSMDEFVNCYTSIAIMQESNVYFGKFRYLKYPEYVNGQGGANIPSWQWYMSTARRLLYTLFCSIPKAIPLVSHKHEQRGQKSGPVEEYRIGIFRR